MWRNDNHGCFFRLLRQLSLHSDFIYATPKQTQAAKEPYQPISMSILGKNTNLLKAICSLTNCETLYLEKIPNPPNLSQRF